MLGQRFLFSTAQITPLQAARCDGISRPCENFSKELLILDSETSKAHKTYLLGLEVLIMVRSFCVMPNSIHTEHFELRGSRQRALQGAERILAI